MLFFLTSILSLTAIDFQGPNAYNFNFAAHGPALVTLRRRGTCKQQSHD